MMHRQKASRNAAAADGLTSRNSLLMGEPRQAAAGWQSVSRPMPKLTSPQSQPQAAASPPHSAPPTAPLPPPHQLPQQQRLPSDFEVHRRRNSQPSRSSSSSGQQQSQQQRHHHQHHHHSLTRNSFSGRSCPAPSSLGVANQRVTEWLRTAGALPEETEFENLDMSAAAVTVVDSAGDPQACPRQQNVHDMARWSRNSGLSVPRGVTTTTAPHYPTVTLNSAYALQLPLSSAPPTGGAVTNDRRIRPAVPVHAVAAAPKGQSVRLPEAPDNFSFSGPGAGSGGGDAFSNLLYDTGCNVVYPRPPETQFSTPAAVTAFGPEQVEQALSGLNFGRNPAAALPACHRTPQPSARNRNIPRTNPAFVGQTSNFTMPRLSAAAAGGGDAWPGNNRLSQQAPVGSAHLAAFPELGSVSAAPPPQPRSDQLNGVHKPLRDRGFANGFQAAAADTSPDTELTNESASATDSDDQEMGEVVRDQQSDLLCTSRDDDLFESHARFSPVVDEYTFTVDRTGNLAGGGAPADPPPPVPPPRTASAEASVRSAPPPPHSPMDAASIGNRQSSLADDSSTWQSFASPTLGFLPRGHPFRQPTFRTTRQPGSADEEPILQDETGQSISSRTQSTVSQDAITTSASVCSTGLQPRRSASGGFLGPTESESSAPPTGPPPSSLAPVAAASMKPESGVIMPSVSSNSATHFALISGPFSWPKELFRPGQDYTTLMFWTKSTFTKRLLSATDKNLQKIVSENFKLIQSFMGDRSAKMSRPDLASVIVHRGIATPSLRDELYAQLCKQTTGNYNADSLMRGWELLCLCLYFFPPNKVFRDPLRAYLAARCEALSIAEACAVSSGSGNVSACASETGTTNSDRLSAAGGQPPPRPGPSLAAAAALAAGSDPALISATSITPIFGVPVSVLGKPGGGVGGGTVSSSTSAPSGAGGGGGAESVFYVDHSSGTPECQLVGPSTAVADFPYGPWVKLSALHFTRAAPRWFMRSIAVSSSRPQANISNAELLHVKDFLLKPCVFGGSLEEIMKIQYCRFPSLRLPWIQIFLTEELLRLNGAKAQGIFRLSTDLDTFTTVRFQLEKLFEVFRLVHVIPKDTGDRSSTLSSQSSNESPAAGAGAAAAIGQYTILRPPPAGWSRSQLIFAPEAPLQQQQQQQQQEEASPAYPLLLPCANLTGSFSLPLRPTPIPERPSEYMLLTPRASWPADLAEAPDAGASADGGTSASCPLDPHLAAGLLKLWIRELATPLIPPGLMAEVLASAKEAEAFELRAGAGAPPSSPAVKNKAGGGGGDGKPVTPIRACCALIRRLPPLSRRCLLYLIKLLQFLARPENSSVSLMDARNLATVIAPNLFRSSSTNASEMLNSVQSQTAFVRLLITYLDVDAEADLLNAEPDADPVRPRFRSPPRARINADGILIPFR